MKTGKEFLTDLWRDIAGLPEVTETLPMLLPSLEELKESEWCPEFEQGMRDRLVMGAFRYGLMARQDYSNYNLIKEAKGRLSRYSEDNNLEHLMDAANMCLLSYVHGQRQGQTVNSVDDGKHSERIK